MLRRGFVDFPDGQIHYVTAGEGDPVVFLHPSPHSWNYFHDAIPHLAPHVRFIGLDTIGYGDSSRPRVPYRTMAEFAQGVVWLLDGLGLERASVVGHLTGAQIAAEVGAGFGDRVDKLVLSEVFNWDTPERRAVHERLHHFAVPQKDGSHLLDIWSRFARRADTMGVDWVDRLFLNTFKANMGEQPVEAYGHMGWDGAAPWAMCHYPLWERAPRISAPTLALHGDHSVLRRAQDRLVATIPRCRATLYESVNMGGPAENPAGWAARVLEFLREPSV